MCACAQPSGESVTKITEAVPQPYQAQAPINFTNPLAAMWFGGTPVARSSTDIVQEAAPQGMPRHRKRKHAAAGVYDGEVHAAIEQWAQRNAAMGRSTTQPCGWRPRAVHT